MRHLSNITDFNKSKVDLNFLTHNMNYAIQNNNYCYSSEELILFGEDFNYKFTIIVTIVSINIVLLLGIIMFILRLIYKKVFIYREDDYKTTITINHMV
jgi:hypothetical protein